jgi:hypothetical protein
VFGRPIERLYNRTKTVKCIISKGYILNVEETKSLVKSKQKALWLFYTFQTVKDGIIAKHSEKVRYFL